MVFLVFFLLSVGIAIARIPDIPCLCKDLVNKGGHGNCLTPSQSSLHNGKLMCYVEQPSGCNDLVDSGSNKPEMFLEEACASRVPEPEKLIAIHCEWYAWVLGECSKECGAGSRNDTRTKKVKEANGGTCTGDPTRIEICTKKECPVHCEWNNWVPEKCSEPCGGGMQKNTRTENKSADHGGDECEGATTMEVSCNTQECPVHGAWTLWGAYGGCSVTCETGTKQRNRTCTNPAPFAGGSTCAGDSTQSEACNTGVTCMITELPLVGYKDDSALRCKDQLMDSFTSKNLDAELKTCIAKRTCIGVWDYGGDKMMCGAFGGSAGGKTYVKDTCTTSASCTKAEAGKGCCHSQYTVCMYCKDIRGTVYENDTECNSQCDY